jgi:hypothetical protein
LKLGHWEVIRIFFFGGGTGNERQFNADVGKEWKF